MRNLKYEAAKLDLSYRGLARKLKTKSLSPIVKAFETNINRVASLLDLPVSTASFFSSLTIAMLDAEENLHSEFKDKAIKSYREFREEIEKSNIDEVDDDRVQNFIDLGQAFEKRLKENLQAEIKKIRRESRGKYWSNAFFVGPMVAKMGRSSLIGLEAVLSASILGTWTAFETLAGDLWEEAVNTCPRPLAEQIGPADRIWKGIKEAETKKSGGKKKSNPGPSLGGPKTTDESKHVTVKGILDATDSFSIDLKHRMGSLLRAHYDFSVLSQVRSAYSSSFWCYSKDIDAALSDRTVDALNLVRNLLVHSAGKADKPYVDSIRGTPAPVLAKGKELKLDGGIVKSLIEPVVKRSSELIVSVDIWIRDERDGKHPTAQRRD